MYQLSLSKAGSTLSISSLLLPQGRGPGKSFPVVQGGHYPGEDCASIVIGHAKVCCRIQRIRNICGFAGRFSHGGFQDGFLVGERVHVKQRDERLLTPAAVQEAVIVHVVIHVGDQHAEADTRPNLLFVLEGAWREPVNGLSNLHVGPIFRGIQHPQQIVQV